MWLWNRDILATCPCLGAGIAVLPLRGLTSVWLLSLTLPMRHMLIAPALVPPKLVLPTLAEAPAERWLAWLSKLEGNGRSLIEVWGQGVDSIWVAAR